MFVKLTPNPTYSLDDVTRKLIPIRKVSLDDLRQATQDLIGPDIKTLQTSLLPVAGREK